MKGQGHLGIIVKNFFKSGLQSPKKHLLYD